MSNPRRSNGTKRDRLIRRVKREEDTCHLCGQWVDTRLPHGLPGSPEVDEVIPVAFGGDPYDRVNCRLAHRHCNRRRGTLPVAVAQTLLRAEPPRFNTFGDLVATILEPVVSRRW